MSVYIKGEEFYKPIACAPCKLRNWCQLWRQVVLPAHIVHPECPISEVQPHGRLIDADALEQDAQKRMLICDKYDNQFQRPHEIMRAIALAPTVIPVDKEAET